MPDISAKSPLDISYDAAAGRLVIRTPGGLVVHVHDPREAKQAGDTPDLVISPTGDALHLNATRSLSVNSMGHLSLSGQDGVTINSGRDVALVADNNVTAAAAATLSLTAGDITAQAQAGFKVNAGTTAEMTSDVETSLKAPLVSLN